MTKDHLKTIETALDRQINLNISLFNSFFTNNKLPLSREEYLAKWYKNKRNTKLSSFEKYKLKQHIIPTTKYSKSVKYVFVITDMNDKIFHPYKYNVHKNKVYIRPELVKDDNILALIKEQLNLSDIYYSYNLLTQAHRLSVRIVDLIKKYIEEQGIKIQDNNVAILIHTPIADNSDMNRFLLTRGLVPIKMVVTDYGPVGKATGYITYIKK